jgi:chain length determinant protein tyrosine kinase EpsG
METGPDVVLPASTTSKLPEASIGRLLVDMGKISVADAERIIRLQKEQGLRFGDAAKKLGMVTDADISQVLSLQFEYPYLQPGQGNFSNDLVAAYYPFSIQVEALRTLRSQLVLRWFSEGHRMLAITSPNSRGGCSYVAANLAVVFSQSGENTLLIDANLRNPTQHALFSLHEPRGLSDILVGRSGPETIVRVQYFVGLSVLGTGTKPPNPQELLNRNSFPELLMQVASQYDVVIIDTPPALTSSDMQIITTQTHGALMVARRNLTKLSELNRTKQLITESGAQAVGVVINDF